jgi:glycosyltransferase involved in cell wall biosynthesis
VNFGTILAVKKIYIDGLGLVEGHFSGVGQYILGIVRGIDDLIDEAKYQGKPVPQVRVIIPYNTVNKFKSYKFKHIGYKTFPLTFRVMSALWYRGKLPPIDLWCGRGTYIFPRFVSMPLAFSKSALVVFDLSYVLHKQYSDDRNAQFLTRGVRSSLAKSKKVIVISESVKKELLDYYKTPASEVAVATPATDPKVFYRRGQQEIDRVKQKYGIKGDYILSLSNLEPRKNLLSLVDAYCQLDKSTRDNTALLLVGVNGWKTEALFDHIIDKVQQGYNIIRPSKYVSDKDKAAIISGAKMLVYPSHYEGFGMPPLEALACGVPVITANNSSLPEAVGKAGIMADCSTPEDLLKAMQDALSRIDSLIQQTITDGPEHARNFSWKKSAQVFLDAAREIN